MTGGQVNSTQPQVKSSHRQVHTHTHTHTHMSVLSMLTGTFVVDFDYGHGTLGGLRGQGDIATALKGSGILLTISFKRPKHSDSPRAHNTQLATHFFNSSAKCNSAAIRTMKNIMLFLTH